MAVGKPSFHPEWQGNGLGLQCDVVPSAIALSGRLASSLALARLLAKRMVQFDNIISIPISFCLMVDETYQGKNKGKQIPFKSFRKIKPVHPLEEC